MDSLLDHLSLPISTYVLQYSITEPWLLPDGCQEFKSIYKIHNKSKTFYKVAVHNKPINLRLMRRPSTVTIDMVESCSTNGLVDVAIYLLDNTHDTSEDDPGDMVKNCHYKLIDHAIKTGRLSINHIIVECVECSYYTALSYVLMRHKINIDDFMNGYRLIPPVGEGGRLPDLALLRHLTLFHGLDLSKLPPGRIDNLLRLAITKEYDQEYLGYLVSRRNFGSAIADNADKYLGYVSDIGHFNRSSEMREYILELKRKYDY